MACRCSHSQFTIYEGRARRCSTNWASTSDWIEKCLTHEDGRSSRGVYNKAEYEVRRRHMMQQWSDIIDAWVEGKKRVPVLIPSSMPLFEPDPALEQGVTAVA
jgi:hypothetical protein